MQVVVQEGVGANMVEKKFENERGTTREGWNTTEGVPYSATGQFAGPRASAHIAHNAGYEIHVASHYRIST